MEARRANRYNTTTVVAVRSTSKKHKTAKISGQTMNKEEFTNAS